jgi:transposase
MLRSSFVPPPEIRALRQYTRQLLHLTQDRTRCWQRLEKTLEDALCKLMSVVSKLAGSASCRAMIEAMIVGERDPGKLADLALTRMQGKRPELVKAFTGMRFGEEHAFAAAGHLRAVDFLDGEIAALEKQVAAHIAAVPAAWGIDADGTTGPDAGGEADAAVLPAVAGLGEIPGVSPQIAIALIAEIGLDMSRFPTPEALTSWAGLTPVADQSGPRKGRGKKGKGNSCARRLATLAADGAAGTAGTATFLGERHRRLSSRPGGGGRKKPTSPSDAPSSSSSGTCSRTPPPATATSARTTTPGTPAPAARSAATSASCRPSASTSPSPRRKTPPDLPAPLTAYRRRQAPGPVPATGPSRRLPEQRSRQTAEVVISRSDRPRKWPELHRRR